ncbi:MAG TPA: ABC transporter substrate-binding protein [Roseomonas sp.]
MRMLSFAACGIAAAWIAAPPAMAQTLTIGQSAQPSSVDPHFFNGTANKALSAHIFDRLVEQTPDTRLVPGLAVSWAAVNETVWEFHLRPDVRFSDGQPLTAEDVAFTVQRAPNVPNSPGGFGGVVRAIRRVEIVDPLTIRFHTDQPTPNLPGELSNLAIISRAVGEGAATEDYNRGRAAIGTGPYRLVQFVPGERAELERNDGWWGPRPDWQRVTIRFIPNAGTRSAAMLSGAVDMIDAPSPNDLPRFRGDARFNVVSRESTRMVFVALDQGRDGASPFVTDANGTPLPRNPLRDLRVRRALSIAINRQALAERIMQGTATPTGQWMQRGAYSYNPSVPVPIFDPDAARRMLGEAGYAAGFRIVLHAPLDTRPTDPATAQAIGQMWTRIGVQTSVETMPASVYNARGARQELSAGIWAWGSNSGEAGYALINVFGTIDRAQGTGAYNRSNYANRAIDQATARALATLDDAARERQLMAIVADLTADVPVIPLYQLTNVWVTRRGIAYEPSAHERNSAMQARNER